MSAEQKFALVTVVMFVYALFVHPVVIMLASGS